MIIQVKKITTSAIMDLAFQIRKRVFVIEQNVDEREEYDEFEETSVHFLAWADGNAAGTARWRKMLKGIKLERFAILESYRSKGIGSALVQAVLNDLPAEAAPVYLHAQLTAIGLYKKFGFIESGTEFSEAGIMHIKMVLEQKTA